MDLSFVLSWFHPFLSNWKFKIHILLLTVSRYLIRFKILHSCSVLLIWLHDCHDWVTETPGSGDWLQGQGHCAHCSVFLISRWAQCLPDFPMSWPLLSPSMVTPRWAPWPLWGYSDSILWLSWWWAVQWWAFMTNYWAGNDKHALWISIYPYVILWHWRVSLQTYRRRSK